MPRYQFDFETDEQTAASLVSLCLGACTSLSFRMVEPASQQVLPPSNGRTGKPVHRVKGTSTVAEIFKLCATNANNSATRARIEQVFARLGFRETSIGPAISRMALTDLFEKHKDGIRMLSDKTTLEQVLAADKAYRLALLKESSK